MALVTVQRSPCGTTTSSDHESHTTDEIDGTGYKEEDGKKERKSVSECYFAVKGAALVLPHDECLHVYRKPITNGVSFAASDIQQHLQTMLYLLHSDDILKMAVKLESMHNGRTRYLVVVSHIGKQKTEESCLLGIDCNVETTIGLVLPVWADTRITLDGDGGFSVTSSGQHHIFKPVSVQAMWSALQTLHKAGSNARECNYYKGGGTHQWIDYYEKRITSDRSCLNEWHAMDDLESRRPPSPDTVRSRPTEREETEKHIRAKLKELMMSVDLDEVTSKYIRTRLEEILDMNLKEFKSFIDQEMLTILGQMDAPTEIFQYLYLGSEWNASNLEELVVNGIGHILNVTREIDNFFPGIFNYQNIRVYDEETTEILHYWDKTYRYIRKAKEEGSKVLVHCKMGISRSASVVIAYVMKAYDWNLEQALSFVKNKRNCIKPNSGFLKQLEIYQGILDASKHRHNSLWRSKSETNLKSNDKPKKEKSKDKVDGLPVKSESLRHLQVPGTSSRPKSWSPSDAIADILFPTSGSVSSETLSKDVFQRNEMNNMKDLLLNSSRLQYDLLTIKSDEERVSNSARPGSEERIPRVSSIKDRISELESQVSSATSDVKIPHIEVKSPSNQSRGGLVLNLATQFESGSKPSSPVDEGLVMKPSTEEEIVEPILSQTKPPVHKHHAILVRPALWCEDNSKLCLTNSSNSLHLSDRDNMSSSPISNRLISFQSAVSCSDKKQADNNGISLRPIETINTSHSICDSAFKPVPVKGCGKEMVGQLNVISDTASHRSVSNAKKIPTSEFSLATAQDSNKTEKPLRSPVSPKLHTAYNHCKYHELNSSLSSCGKEILAALENLSVPSKQNLIYDKEDIPFTPGMVQRTRQQIEEKSLTRTTSFDSGFPLHFNLMPSTIVDFDQFWGKPVRRSRSLRSDHRPTSMFSSKWYPLPALASLSPKPLKSSDEYLVFYDQKISTAHSASTPSVVEAVNEVICGTKEVIDSAIQSMPTDKNINFCCTNIDTCTDFGSTSSLPEIEVEDVLVGKTPARSESPVPGIVRQQCELLESKTPKTPLQDKNDAVKKKIDTVKLATPLVSNDLLVKVENEKDLGLVKRLTKELEAKSSTELLRKEKISLGDSDLSRSKSQDKCCTNTFPTESHNPTSCPDVGLGPRKPSGLRSSLPTSVEKKLSCNVAAPLAPPTPHRKTSLDLNFLRKTSRLPLTFKLHNQPKTESLKDHLASTTNTTAMKTCNQVKPVQLADIQVLSDSSGDCYKSSSGRPPHAVKMSLPDIPPPPPLPSGIPRKTLRKQHGSTHPLSRLTIRQRHTNPLYNTM